MDDITSRALVSDPETRRALQLDTLSAILPMERRDRLAELLTAADDALGRYARKQYDGPDAYNANAAAVEALTARLRAELLPDAPRDVTGRLLLRATDPDGLARRVVELRRLKRTVTVQAVDATGALSGEPLVLPLSTSGLTARLSAGGGAYGSWAVTLPETPEPQPRKSRARP